jgi:hypothetical protein
MSAREKGIVESVKSARKSDMQEFAAALGKSDMEVAMKEIEAKRDLVKDLNEGNLAVAKEANKPQLSQQVLGLMEKYLVEDGLTVDQTIEKAEATVKRLQGL